MRALAALLLAAFLAPLAVAQLPGSTLRLDVDPFGQSAQPLQGPVTTSFSLTLGCTSDRPGEPASAVVWVAEKPAWATAVVSPARFAAPSGCATSATVTGTLSVTTSELAPARKPGAIALMAAQTDPTTGNHTTRARVDVSATYFSILDAQVLDAVKSGKPGEAVPFAVKLSNLGNDDTRVTFALVEKSEWLDVRMPEPIVLGSKQQGNDTISRDVTVLVTGPRGTGYLNKVGSVTIASNATALADGAQGDTGRQSFVLTVKGLDSPLATAAPLVALAAAALALRRRKER